ncbi:MAG: hypothetical protein KDD19_27095 [Phaeodactylibacter sp.]|nr:hypothetical protein [Phaeodactylibacter sp.]MCB9050482.1 hypothetical protein [Lewinellaceae bacterium]
MKTTTILVAFILAAALSACSEDPFFELEAPAELPLKEQLQSDEEESCFHCRPAPENETPVIVAKEQLQEQDEMRHGCPGCRSLPPGASLPVLPLWEPSRIGQAGSLGSSLAPPGVIVPPVLEKEQLQGDSAEADCPECWP